MATEDYATAKKIKNVEGELKSLGTQLAQLVNTNNCSSSLRDIMGNLSYFAVICFSFANELLSY